MSTSERQVRVPRARPWCLDGRGRSRTVESRDGSFALRGAEGCFLAFRNSKFNSSCSRSAAHNAKQRLA